VVVVGGGVFACVLVGGAASRRTAGLKHQHGEGWCVWGGEHLTTAGRFY
jgi:hypothetical protein